MVLFRQNHWVEVVVGLVLYLLRDMKELVVLLLLPNRLPSREEHLDVLVEVSVLEELTVVLQEADQLLPGGEEEISSQNSGQVNLVDFHLVMVGTSLGSSIWSFPITFTLESNM